jgi:NADH:ubiquinone oxidoreductase subunit E
MPKTNQITDMSAVKRIVDEYRGMPGCIMPILQKVQEAYGYLPFEIQQEIAEELGVPMSDIFSVATFYSQFTLTKKGEYLISVCLGTACYVKGSQSILDRLAVELGVEVGATTEDGLFTLEATRCLGCCGLAPVIKINDEVYGGLKPDDIPKILAQYR